MAWREFTDGFGDEMVAFAKHVLFGLPDVAPAGEKGYVNFVPAKLDVWREAMRYGIGKHANQAQDTGRGDLIVQPKYPIGTNRRLGMIFTSAPLKLASVGSKYVTIGAPPARLLRPVLSALKIPSVHGPARMASMVMPTVRTVAPTSGLTDLDAVASGRRDFYTGASP